MFALYSFQKKPDASVDSDYSNVDFIGLRYTLSNDKVES